MTLPHIIGGEIKSQELNDNFAHLDDRLKYAKAPVDEYEHLPTEGNEEGDYRIVKYGDDSGIYFWDGDEWNILEMSSKGVRYESGISGVEDNVKGMLDHMKDVAIVDDNLKNSDPPNGWYVKWANGFAVCWRRMEYYDFDHGTGSNNIPYPIDFRSGMVAAGGAISSSWLGVRESLMEKPPLIYAGDSNWLVVIDHPDIDPERINRISLWAFGIAE